MSRRARVNVTPSRPETAGIEGGAYATSNRLRAARLTLDRVRAAR